MKYFFNLKYHVKLIMDSIITLKIKAIHKILILRRPGVGPVSTVWKKTKLTITPPTHHLTPPKQKEKLSCFFLVKRIVPFS